MKIAMIGHKDFPSRSGGIEVMVHGLATRLAKRGHDVTVYNRGREKGHNFYQAEGVTVRRIFTFEKPSLNAAVYSFLATFDALVRDYDVIHYHAIGPSVPLFLAHLFGKRTVCTVHGLNWKVDKWGGFAATYLKWGEKIAAKYSDVLVVLSKEVQDYFRRTYGRESVFIPNAIELHEPLPCDLIRKEYGLEPGSYIFSVGRISPEKGPQDLVEAYFKAHTDKKLVIAGPMYENEFCDKLRTRMAENENILYIGYVEGQALRELYSNCAVYVLPSHTEGLSLALLEALSLGAKCLVSDIPENTIVTREFGAEFRTMDTDSLARALDEVTAAPPDPDLVRRQREYVRATYDYEVLLDHYEEAYRQAVQPRGH